MQWQTAQHDGIYFVSAQIRLDGADQGWFSLAVLTNSEQSFETGMSSLIGDVKRPAIRHESRNSALASGCRMNANCESSGCGQLP